jgi:hypothetical protein
MLAWAHASRALFSGLFCVLKIGFFLRFGPEKLLENGVIYDFYRPAMCCENRAVGTALKCGGGINTAEEAAAHRG